LANFLKLKTYYIYCIVETYSTTTLGHTVTSIVSATKEHLTGV